MSSAQSSSSTSSAPSPSSTRPIRQNYHVYQGRNVFVCGGRAMVGPDYRAFWTTTALTIVPTILFITCPCVDLISREGVWVIIVASLLLGSTLVCLTITASSDPGIIPRKDKGDAEEISFIIRPRIQDLTQGGQPTQLKYCDTCNIYRPPRAVHCNICDNCVEVFDHHCPWIGTCVGKRNYRIFHIFLYFLSSQLLYTLAICIYHMYVITKEYMNEQGYGGAEAFGKTLGRNPVSFIVALFCFVFMFFVIGLTGYHLYLVMTGQTTNEQLKHAFPFGSPYNVGIVKNFLSLFCTRPLRGHLHPHATLISGPVYLKEGVHVKCVDAQQMRTLEKEHDQMWRNRYPELIETKIENESGLSNGINGRRKSFDISQAINGMNPATLASLDPRRRSTFTEMQDDDSDVDVEAEMHSHQVHTTQVQVDMNESIELDAPVEEDEYRIHPHHLASPAIQKTKSLSPSPSPDSVELTSSIPLSQPRTLPDSRRSSWSSKGRGGQVTLHVADKEELTDTAQVLEEEFN